ncbi:NmrA family NAD(P)-binding protein [Baekduia alba]|uniref:NmrA family NAD(P)-binding protein n=1 Tax=Baekduia alba TaxID=2997333 RepID=UPI0023423902|nr:NmrA family NAD(P)-binding protein [Baekduia alba]
MTTELPTTTPTAPTLVVGATGKTGRRVAAELARRGVPVRAGSRSATPPLDWDDATTWAPALAGTRAAYVSFFPDLAVPGAGETVGAFAALAAREGVERLVLLSGRGEEEAQRAEEVVRAAGVPTTIVRAAWFCQNFSESFLLDAVLGGTVALPVDGIAEPFVDADDIAAVAVAALTEDGHAGEVYEVTGPRLLTFADAVAEIAAAAGRELSYVSVPLDEWTAELVRAGVDDDTLALLSYLFAEVLDGRNAHTTDGVQRALGRPPRDFGAFAADTAATGVWHA